MENLEKGKKTWIEKKRTEKERERDTVKLGIERKRTEKERERDTVKLG